MSIVPPLRTAGIYKITCIPTGKFYIGSSQCIRKRWQTHRQVLRRGAHDNTHLQNAWVKYGADAFDFAIIESVLFVEDLIRREQHYLDTLKPYKRSIGFNIGIFADAASRGRKASATTRAKISAAQRNIPKPWLQTPEVKAKAKKAAATRRPPSAESRKRQGDSARGWHQTPEARQKIRDTWAQKPKIARHIVTTPEGEELLVPLYAFCQERGLNYTCMKNAAKGRCKTCKGYTARRADQE